MKMDTRLVLCILSKKTIIWIKQFQWKITFILQILRFFPFRYACSKIKLSDDWSRSLQICEGSHTKENNSSYVQPSSAFVIFFLHNLETGISLEWQVSFLTLRIIASRILFWRNLGQSHNKMDIRFIVQLASASAYAIWFG